MRTFKIAFLYISAIGASIISQGQIIDVNNLGWNFDNLFLGTHEFQVSGIINDGEDDLIGALEAQVIVEFWDTDENVQVDALRVFVTNKAINGVDVTSFITGFSILDPLSQGVRLDPDFPQDGNDESPTGTDDFASGNAYPSDWTTSNTVDNFLKGFGGVQNESDYFSANAGTGLENLGADLQAGFNTNISGTGIFTFTFEQNQFDYSSNPWGTDEQNFGMPIAMVRWQSILMEGVEFYDGGEGSGKGGTGPGFVPGFDPSVPEPSEVALIAMLGLGGLLLGRRRFVRKI